MYYDSVNYSLIEDFDKNANYEFNSVENELKKIDELRKFYFEVFKTCMNYL